MLAGIIITIIEVMFPHKFSTILELDYDTPYDRHIIIEESHDVKKKKRKLEEPLSSTFGSKIFRRFSKRGEGEATNQELKLGIVNPAMEMDPPKSPWRYPHRTFSAPIRSESRKSTKSVNFRDHSVVYGPTLRPPIAVPGIFGDASQTDIIPDIHIPVLEHLKQHEIMDSDSSSDGVSSSDEAEEAVERLPTSPLTSVVSVDFQSQFRSVVSRQNSHDSVHSRTSSAVHFAQPSSKSRSSSSASSTHPASGASTPSRKISSEDNAIQLDRTGSYRQGSGLASISARISAAVQADRKRFVLDPSTHLLNPRLALGLV